MIGTCGMIEARACAAEAAAIAKLRAVGSVRMIAVNQAVAMPIRSPAVPPPAEATEETDAKSGAEPDSRSVEEEARIFNPTWVERDGVTVDDPGIVFRHINDLWIRRFNDDGIPLVRDGFLLGALQVPGQLRSLTHRLNRVKHILLAIYVRLSERRGPRQILIHHAQQPTYLCEGLYTGIPRLGIDRLGEGISLQIGMLLQPPVRFDDLRRISRRGQDLRDQRIRIQRDRRDQLLQLLG